MRDEARFVFVLIIMVIVVLIAKCEEKFGQRVEYGPEKPYAIDLKSLNFRMFRYPSVTPFEPDEYFYYCQEADNFNSIGYGQKIIVRKKSDGQFFLASPKDPQIKLAKGQRVRLTFVMYSRSLGKDADDIYAEPF